MVCNATFNNISSISWQSVLLVEETGVSGENHRPVTASPHSYKLKERLKELVLTSFHKKRIANIDTNIMFQEG
jgi:hypothetical protein